MVFFVDDSRRRIYTEFTRITTSQCTDALDAIIHHRWAECCIHRSENFLDDEATYHQCDDALTITIVDQVSLEPIVNDESGLCGTSRFIYLTSKETPTHPAILHRPDRIHSYEDDQLFWGFVTNFHNEIGATYQWHLNDTVILTGASHALIRIKEPVTHFCQVFSDDLPLTLKQKSRNPASVG